MLKIKDSNGKVMAILKDEDNEPEIVDNEKADKPNPCKGCCEYCEEDTEEGE